MDPDSLLPETYVYILITAVLLLLTGIFALCEECSENASARIDKLKDEALKKRLNSVYDRITPDNYTCGRVMTLCGCAVCLCAALFPYHNIGNAFVDAFLATILLWAVADSLPRRIVNEDNEDKLLRTMAGTANILYAFSAALDRIRRAFSGKGKDESVTAEEIIMMAEEGSQTGDIEESELEMIANVFEFHDKAVTEVMTHRLDVVSADISAELSEVVYTAINSGFSRIPVCDKGIDHIVGVIYVKDLLCLMGMENMQSMSVKSFVRDVYYVPESCMCNELFKTFTAKKLQFAVVVDEYGGTSGIVTMEDLVEAIVGEIQDEYDNESEPITKLDDGTYLIDGDATVDEVFEALSLVPPEELEFFTIGAFITSLIGHLPEDGEKTSVQYENIRFTIILAEDMHIERIKAEAVQ